MDNPKLQILSLDGGGWKGHYAVAFLAAIEEEQKVKIDEHFDLIVGTSTGALVACGLALGVRPRELVHFYCDHGWRIFPCSYWRKLYHFFGAKYNNKALEKALRNILKDYRMKDCRRRLVIPAYWHNRDIPRIFKTPHSLRFHRDGNLPVWQVAMASAAAPTYFSAAEGIDNSLFVDGGIYANNPILIGLVEALTNLNGRLGEISILSIGTSSELVRYSKRLRMGGFLQWRKEAMRVCMRGQSLCATNQARLLVGDANLMRFDPIVPAKLLKLDKPDPDELLSLAAQDSLRFGRELRDRFLQHKVIPFDPSTASDGAATA